MKTVIKIVAIVSTLFLNGCASIDKNIVPERKPLQAKHHVEFLPKEFENRLLKLAELARAYDRQSKPRVYLERTKSFYNETNNHGLQIRLEQAFHSAASIFGDVVDNSPEAVGADFVLTGAVDAYDERVWVMESTYGTDVAIKRSPQVLDTFFTRGNSTYHSELGISINAINVASRTYDPTISTSVKAELTLEQSSGEYGLIISGLGFDRQISLSRQNGPQSSAKLLVYSATAEALSKMLYLPYWLIMPELKPNRRIQDRLVTEFYCVFSKAKQAKIIQYLRTISGHSGSYEALISAKTTQRHCGNVVSEATKERQKGPQQKSASKARTVHAPKPVLPSTQKHIPKVQPTLPATVISKAPVKPIKVKRVPKATPVPSQATQSNPMDVFRAWNKTDLPLDDIGPSKEEIFK